MSTMLFIVGFIASQAMAGPRLDVPTLAVDDVQAENLQCEAAQGLFLLGPAVVGSLVGRTEALAGCAPGLDTIELRWAWSEGKPATLTPVGGDEALTRCVAAAVRVLPVDATGTCTAAVKLAR